MTEKLLLAVAMTKLSKFGSTAKLKKTLRGHLDYIKCLNISPDGQSIISASRNREIKIWGLPEDISQC